MNLGFEIGFGRPWFLLLLLALPAIWFLSFNSLAGLGRWRRLFALAFRTAVFSLLVLALADTQWRQSTDTLTVIYLLDQSDSIPSEKKDFMLNYVHEAVNTHRRQNREDKAGVIIFGREPKIEAAPFDGDLPLIDRFEAGFDLNTGATSLEAALKLAKATFPEDTARRVVIVSDGNENLGDALSTAQSMANDGIGIDVLPVDLLTESEVSVDKVVLPSDLRKGQEFKARVVLNNDTQPTEDNPDGLVKGTLRLTQKTRQNEQLIAEEVITLEPGKNVREFKHKIDQSAVFTFDASFVPLDDRQDLVQQNNQASAFTHVRGKGRILLIEDANSPGEFINLVEKLQANNIEVDVMRTDELFTSMEELVQYDSIVLANVPRASGDTVEETVSFSDAQIRMLVRNCEKFTCGLVMLGGGRSFGAGGWANTELEKAMPIDFQIKNDKVDAVGALVMMMHASEIAQSNFWQTQIAREAIKILGPMDYCGVVVWGDMGGVPRWLWKVPSGVDRVFGNRKKMMGMVGRMAVGDMPDFNAPMKLALQGFKNCGGGSGNPSMKHMIIISDGDPTPPTNRLLQDYVKAGVKISTVACGTHMQANNPLKNIARVTGGKYYAVKNAKALPKIFQREARRVAKPVIKESRNGMNIRVTPQGRGHEILQGIEASELPPFIGYVMSTIKKDALVEQIALSDDPSDDGENSTLIASWRYGAGRATAFTSDAGHIWTADWLNNPAYEKLFVQMIRHSMRPITEEANFTVSTDIKDNKARIVVTALDENEEFLNFLDIGARGIRPDLEGFNLEFNQTGPGRYVAEYELGNSGNYLFSIFPGEGYERLTAGVNVPYSSEYRDREANRALLETIAQLDVRGGDDGQVIEGALSSIGLDQLMAVNSFRPTLKQAIGIQDVWPLLVLIGGLVFFTDVFIRRVAIDFKPVAQAIGNVRARLKGQESEERQESIARLRSRKAEIEKAIETRRARARFEPDEVDENISGAKRLENIIGDEMEKTPKRAPQIERDKLDVDSDTSYTSRLLDAKRKAQKNRRESGDFDPEDKQDS